MAFKNVNTGGKKLTDLKIGDSLIGYVVRFEESSLSKTARKDDPDAPIVNNLVMQDEGSKENYTVFSAGNVKYMINDGKIQTGLLTKITRIDDAMVGKKLKKKSSQFTVEQDPDRAL